MRHAKPAGIAGHSTGRLPPAHLNIREAAADLDRRKASHAMQGARMSALRDRRRGIARTPRFLALLGG